MYFTDSFNFYLDNFQVSTFQVFKTDSQAYQLLITAYKLDASLNSKLIFEVVFQTQVDWNQLSNLLFNLLG